VAVLSHRSLLRHVLATLADTRPLFEQSVSALGVGSFGESVVVVPNTTSVLSVLNVLAERRISSVPLVNELGQVTDLYSREDVAFLANDLSLRVLDAPVGEVRRAQATLMGPPLPLLTCHKNETLHRCLELFAAMGGRCQRLICVDEHSRCTGIISLSDVFAFVSRSGPVRLRPRE
jgi:CBS domain-containing protein